MANDFIKVEDEGDNLHITGKCIVKADNEIPRGIVVPAKTEGRVKALPDCEPLFIDGKLNPKVLGRVLKKDGDSVLIELWHS